jgi:hypothetical protein
MTWRRGPEPISPQSEQIGSARVVVAAEVEPAVAPLPPSGQLDARQRCVVRVEAPALPSGIFSAWNERDCCELIHIALSRRPIEWFCAMKRIFRLGLLS